MDPQANLMRGEAFSAYKRGDPIAADLVDGALAVLPRDGGLMIAQATLALEARRPDALDRLAQLLSEAPDWRDGHVALAQLRWGAGCRDTALAAIEKALAVLPRHAGLWMTYMDMLAQTGRSGEAADAAARLRGEGDVPALRLIEARHAGAAGDLDRVDRLHATLGDDLPGLSLDRARQALRRGDPAKADAFLADARSRGEGGVVHAALTELAWRALGDPRHQRLLVTDIAIPCIAEAVAPCDLAELIERLRAIHAVRWPPLGQSVRGGTQTRGALSDRGEPVFARTIAATERHASALADRIAAVCDLAPARPASGAIRSVASWSVRFVEGGHLVPHIHPGGRFGSALHLCAPATTGSCGLLEIGRPPAEFAALGLAPLRTIAPSPGQLVLFPSWLYHGTSAFGHGERLSMAFDFS